MIGYLSRACAAALLFAMIAFLSACSSAQQSNNASPNTNSPKSENTKKPTSSGPPRYDGYLDVASCDAIHGWVWDQNNPDTTVAVEIYDGDTLLANVKADQYRENLVAAGKGSGKYAYTYMVPPQLKDGKQHTIRVKVAGTSFELGNPKTLNCTFK